jgi:nitrate/TMAO reductase-like tetraheme cytochrome c subunit
LERDTLKNKAPRQRRFSLFKKREWPHINIDLKDPTQRGRFFLGLIIFFIVSSGFLFGNFKAYEYSESAEFCGTACHTMDPQWVRFEVSSHSNVECVKCHIGPGMSFFVRSKIDGLRQVYAMITDSYARPINSPVHNLRPARETCETCHSPTTFKDNIVKTIVHYDNDEESTLIQSTLILKMGGWHQSTGFSKGIHWHINSNIYYIAADEKRQVILWVGVEQEDGSFKEYFSRDMLAMAKSDFVEEAFENGEARLMDCIDCHNRTAHNIPFPEEAVDDVIEAGLLSRDLPFIRAHAIDLLSDVYETEAEALQAITSLADQYPQQPEVIVTEAIETIAEVYLTTNFPEMDTTWETNPNNGSHTPTLGCFRCHDGNHVYVDEYGAEVEPISVKCNLCHTVPIVGRGNVRLIEAPVIVGEVPDSHLDFSWTVEHRSITEMQRPECLECHGSGFCANEACHNLSHPPEMLYTHAEEYHEVGKQVCYTCHQDILCAKCHPGGIVGNP